MGEKKKMERYDEKGRLSMKENNYGDHSFAPFFNLKNFVQIAY